LIVIVSEQPILTNILFMFFAIEVALATTTVCCVTESTHIAGGLLDVVANRRDLPLPLVTLYDPGLSDHRIFNGQFLCRGLSNPSYPSFVDRGINSTSSHCRMLSGNHSSVVLNAGPIVLLINLRYCTIVNSRGCLTPWFQSWPSPVVDDHWIPGLTRNVASRNVQCDDSNLSPVPVELQSLRRRWWRSVYHSLLRNKRKSFWMRKMDAKKSSPRQLWRSIDVVLGHGGVPSSNNIDAQQFHDYFNTKVTDFQSLTDGASPPSFTTSSSDVHFTCFEPVTIGEVVAAVWVLPDKIHYRRQHLSPSSMFSCLFWLNYSIVHLQLASQRASIMTLSGCVQIASN